jgi:hypothetical protein
MKTFVRNVLTVLRFRGALRALIADCGRMAYHHLKCDAFGINAGVLWHCDRAVYMGHWDPASRAWSE